MISWGRRHKYGAKRAMVGAISFASQREAKRYKELLLLLAAGEISSLKTQVRFPLFVKNQLVCEYVADFVYFRGNREVVEDVKGFKTPTYIIKRKLMRACLGIEIEEV